MTKILGDIAHDDDEANGFSPGAHDPSHVPDLGQACDAAVAGAQGSTCSTLGEGRSGEGTSSAGPGGNRARDVTFRLRVDGMHCAGCAARVERALLSVPGITHASVSPITTSAEVSAQSPALPLDALAAAVAALGYAIAPEESIDARRQDAVDAPRRAALLASFGAAPMFLVEMAHHFIPGAQRLLAPLVEQPAWPWICLGLASFVLFGPGLGFFSSGAAALRRRAPDMNALVAIGAGAAWAYSLVATAWPSALPVGSRHVYFESASMIVALILIGRWIEARARGRAGRAIDELARLQPPEAHRLDGDLVTDVDVDILVPGDVLVVLPGERIPIDGLVVQGGSFVDESLVTGESKPVRKPIGSRVTGGTFNTTGSFRLEVTHPLSETILSGIVRMVHDAQSSRLPVQAQVDRVTAWFVPGVICLSMATFVGWIAFGTAPALGTALVHAVAVLIVACPCAMGLAMPAAIVVATGRAAELGILFRRGDAIQTLGAVRAVAFDKTGTLTEGRPALVDLQLLSDMSGEEVLRLAASAEACSKHPISRALLGAVARLSIPRALTDEFEALPGLGVKARVAGRAVAVGSRRFLESLGVIAEPLDPAFSSGERATTGVYVAVDGRAVALLTIADPIRESTPAALAMLKEAGLKLILITGDSSGSTSAFRAMGIDRIISEASPDEKLRALEALVRAEGATAYVGDGLNDAPALAAATVGLAMASGSEIAIEGADVVLMHGDPGDVANAIALSGSTMRNITQNLAWAFGYNLLLLPLATGILIPFDGWSISPMFASAAMALSSLSVLANALRLRRFKATSLPSRRELPFGLPPAAPSSVVKGMS